MVENRFIIRERLTPWPAIPKGMCEEQCRRVEMGIVARLQSDERWSQKLVALTYFLVTIEAHRKGRKELGLGK